MRIKLFARFLAVRFGYHNTRPPRPRTFIAKRFCSQFPLFLTSHYRHLQHSLPVLGEGVFWVVDEESRNSPCLAAATINSHGE